MKKKLLVIITFFMFLYGCSVENSKNDINVSDIKNENVITVWEDKNFEALIRYYLNNFDKEIYICLC